MLKHSLAASLLASALLAPNAHAQDSKATETQSAPSPSAAVNYIRALQGEQFRSTSLVGSAVYNRQDENIGDISDLIVDRNGRVVGVIIGVGGFLGIGESSVAVPMNALSFEPQTDAADTTSAADENASEGRAATNVDGPEPSATGNGYGTSTTAAPPASGSPSQTASNAQAGEDWLDDMKVVLNTTREDLTNAPKLQGL